MLSFMFKCKILYLNISVINKRFGKNQLGVKILAVEFSNCSAFAACCGKDTQTHGCGSQVTPRRHQRLQKLFTKQNQHFFKTHFKPLTNAESGPLQFLSL